MFLKFLPFKAPLDFEFKDPDTGYLFRAESRSELVDKIVAYRSQNELPEIFRLDLVIENYLCRMPQHISKCGKNTQLQRQWWHYLKGGVSLIKNMLIENPVSQEVADGRSEVCSKCPHNVFPDKTRFVKWSDKVAEASVPGKRSKFHVLLGNCEVCTCPLRAKVWTQGPFDLKEEEKEKMVKVGCWQIK